MKTESKQIDKLEEQLAKLNQQIKKLQAKNSEQEKIIDAMQDKQKIYDIIVNSIETAIFIKDCHGTITYANKAASKIFGYSCKELTGMQVKKLFPEKIAKLMPNKISKQYLALHKNPKQFTHKRKDGSRFFTKTFMHYITINNKKHILSFVQDISKEKAHTREREMFINQLQNTILEIKELSGLLPICSYCRKIRDDKGYWHQVEDYLQKHADITFSHSICTSCSHQLFPELFHDENQPLLIDPPNPKKSELNL